jgi:hypothetical protein
VEGLAAERERRRGHWATALMLLTALSLGAFGLVRGTWAAGGSDSSCYALMADAFARGQWQPESALAREAPSEDVRRAFAPAGFIPSPVRSDAASPVCSPGFSLLLTPFRWLAGPDGIFVVTPIAAALLVFLTAVLAQALAGRLAGVLAAAIAATTPIVLFQATQPMNDIAVATLWMGALAAALLPEPSRAWLMGALVGLALLVRPNLAPSAVVVAVWLTVVTRAAGASTRQFARTAAAFAIAASPFVAMLLSLNAVLYGGPLQSGYGSAADLFSLAHVVPNIKNYAPAFWDTRVGVMLAALSFAFVAAPRRPIVWLALAHCVAVAAVYLPYRPFEEWWYLRFLLPAIAPMMALLAGVLVVIARSKPMARALLVAVVAVVAWRGIDRAREQQVFELPRLEGRFRSTGELARTRLPANAVFITVWESGTLRFHAERPTMLWDALEPGSLEPSLAWLARHHLEPYLVLEDWEEPQFRQRFAQRSTFGHLDWPPRFVVEHRVRIYRPSDRPLYLRGEPIPTEHVTSR